MLTTQHRRSGCLRKSRAAAIRTDLLFEKLFDSLHTLFILHLGERVLHCIDSVEIGKIHFSGCTAGLILINDVFLDRRPVEYDIPLFFCQLTKRHIGSHAHFSCDIFHQRPHQSLPWPHRTFINGKRFVRYQTCAVNRTNDTGTAAGRTSTLTVKSQHFSAGRLYTFTAHRTDHLLFGCNLQRRRYIMPIWAAMTSQPGKHQPQTVQKLRSGSECAADARHCRSLMQSKRGRYIQDFIHLRPRSPGHSAPCVSR